MNIIFKFVHLHNFLSYGDAEINLENKHYCLVSGINKCAKDNASSNGVGKSTIGSAITWALTGETIQGIKSDIKNINSNDDKCFVELIFSIDADNYKVVRYKSPKSDLKLELNGEDISGKGIKESENILASRLPDLTSQLIASTIILGQGLPQKFTANTPSGRKEVLEQLSKSDYMIQDLKERISSRSQVLNDNLRRIEDILLQLTTQSDMLEQQKVNLQKEINVYKDIPDISTEISQIDSEIVSLRTSYDDKTKELESIQQELIGISSIITSASKQKDIKVSEENDDFNSFNELYLEKKYSIQSEISALEKRIIEISNIKDICPTCGQKIPNIEKPSVAKEEAQLLELKNTLSAIEMKFSSASEQHRAVLKEIEDSFNSENNDALRRVTEIKSQISLLTVDLRKIDSEIKQRDADKSQLISEQKIYESKLKESIARLDDAEKSLTELTTKKLYNNNERDNTLNHISTINQMNTLVKRDFRGFLLNDIIAYINNHAKLYALDIFKSNEVEFILNGNNIDINFCGKPFENLSGGEQQRLDLIIQFSIRDMLEEYLGFSSNILFLDEIFDQLDAVAVNAVLDCILKRLCDIDSVFIISHRAGELEIPYDSEIIITKDENGVSSLVTV